MSARLVRVASDELVTTAALDVGALDIVDRRAGVLLQIVYAPVAIPR